MVMASTCVRKSAYVCGFVAPAFIFHSRVPFAFTPSAKTFHRHSSSWSKAINTAFGMFGGDTLKYSKLILYNCQEQAAKQDWFTRGGDLKPDFRTKHSLLMLHVWLVHKRLLQEGKKGKLIQECLFDEFWEDTSTRIRSQGVGEMSVNKNLKDIQGYSFRMGIELDQAVLASSEAEIIDEIGGALWRSLYRRDENVDESKVLELAKYVRKEQLSIQQLPSIAVMEGRIFWGKLPWAEEKHWQRDRKNKAVGESQSPKSEVGEWREAIAADGKVYYWNTVTRESRWTKP